MDRLKYRGVAGWRESAHRVLRAVLEVLDAQRGVVAQVVPHAPAERHEGLVLEHAAHAVEQLQEAVVQPLRTRYAGIAGRTRDGVRRPQPLHSKASI